jgi:hypothetical protein
MRQHLPWRCPCGLRAGLVLVSLLLGAAAAGFTVGCDALNPAFLEAVLPAEAQTQRTTENVRGHVPIFFINRTQFDGQLLDYLVSIGVVDATVADLRARVRLRVNVEFINGVTLPFEFMDGSQVVQGSVDIGGQAQFVGTLPPDLLEPDLTNQVVQCDVAGVEVVSGTIEVFVPVFLKEIRIEPGAQGTQPTRQLQQVIPPGFRALQVDDVDDRLNIVVTRNIGIRDQPGPVIDVVCGSVVAFILEGTLEVPFVQDENGALVPGYLDTDTASEATIPGRYRVITTTR